MENITMEEMTLAEVLVKEAKENRTREALLILGDCKTLEEAEAKIRELLK